MGAGHGTATKGSKAKRRIFIAAWKRVVCYKNTGDVEKIPKDGTENLLSYCTTCTWEIRTVPALTYDSMGSSWVVYFIFDQPNGLAQAGDESWFEEPCKLLIKDYLMYKYGNTYGLRPTSHLRKDRVFLQRLMAFEAKGLSVNLGDFS